MILKYTIHIFIFCLFALSSCFKKEDAVILPIGNSEVTTIFLGTDYEKEMYFDIGTNTFQERQSVDWDIRFESSPNGYGVFINNGNLISARKIELHYLTEKKSADTNYFLNQKELVDAPDGKAINSAIGDWRTYRSLGSDKTPGIYVIQLNYGIGAKRFKRMQIVGSNDTSYTVVFSDIMNDNGDTITVGDTTIIKKDNTRNFTYYTFKNGGRIVKNAEPDKNTWDLVFTRYKHIFYGILPGNQPFPYRVSGVLSSPNKVVIARDSLTNFNDITHTAINNYNFSDNSNIIGYDWKSHAFGAAGNYTVNSHITYIIKDTEGHFYKLRFLDFYDSKGEKGYPKFEFVRIK